MQQAAAGLICGPENQTSWQKNQRMLLSPRRFSHGIYFF